MPSYPPTPLPLIPLIYLLLLFLLSPPTSATKCNTLEGWIGDGISADDCEIVMSEFLRTNVRPRGEREYEFTTVGGPRASYLPWVVTPAKYDYGTCVLVIAMLYIFPPGGETTAAPQRTHSDTATFYDLYKAATALSSACVEKKQRPQAGWSATGAHDSIGVFILRRGSQLDRVLVRGGSAAPVITLSDNNETSSANLTGALRSPVVLGLVDSQ
ncbi:hypothetical protein BDR22DRAFT_891943 [Usnea florida]